MLVLSYSACVQLGSSPRPPVSNLKLKTGKAPDVLHQVRGETAARLYCGAPPAIKKKVLWTHAATWMNLRRLTLGEKKPIPKGLTPFI